MKTVFVEGAFYAGKRERKPDREQKVMAAVRNFGEGALNH